MPASSTARVVLSEPQEKVDDRRHPGGPCCGGSATSDAHLLHHGAPRIGNQRLGASPHEPSGSRQGECGALWQPRVARRGRLPVDSRRADVDASSGNLGPRRCRGGTDAATDRRIFALRCAARGALDLLQVLHPGVSARSLARLPAAVRRARVPIDRDLASSRSTPSIRRTAASTGDGAGPRSDCWAHRRVHAQSVLHIRRQLARSHARGASACGTSRSSAGRRPRCARSATSPTWNTGRPGSTARPRILGRKRQVEASAAADARGRASLRIAAGVDLLWRDATVGLDAAVPADSPPHRVRLGWAHVSNGSARRSSRNSGPSMRDTRGGRCSRRTLARRRFAPSSAPTTLKGVYVYRDSA